jgi:hypothetical protein
LVVFDPAANGAATSIPSFVQNTKESIMWDPERVDMLEFNPADTEIDYDVMDILMRKKLTPSAIAALEMLTLEATGRVSAERPPHPHPPPPPPPH